MIRVQSQVCANCNLKLFEGQSVLYDELTDRYYCEKSCQEYDYENNVEEYRRKHVKGVDL